MLSNYNKKQPIAYNTLKKAITNKMINHSYLFYADDNAIALDFAIQFAKTLICPENKLEAHDCGNCMLCHRIDNGNFTELKIINPEGLWIKKDQLLVMQEEFKLKSLEGNRKIYIINGVEKLNVHAANSMLKFLEEPEANIIALLTTNDINKVLPTIVSRCQIISLKGSYEDSDTNEFNESNYNETLIKLGKLYYQRVSDLQQFADDEKNVNKIETIIAFVKKYEALGNDVLLETKKIWSDYFTEKQDYIWGFDIMSLLYKDVLNRMYGKKIEIFDSYIECIDFIVSRNKISDIIYKLQRIMISREKIKYNVNLDLLLDKLILEMESGECV